MKTKTVKKVKKVEKIKPDTIFKLDVYFEYTMDNTVELTITKEQLLRFLDRDDELRNDLYDGEVWGDIISEHINYKKMRYDLSNKTDRKNLLKLLSS